MEEEGGKVRALTDKATNSTKREVDPRLLKAIKSVVRYSDSELQLAAFELLEKWNASFGVHYRQIRLGFDYLKNTLRLQFPNLQANAARIQQERREREMKTKEILRKIKSTIDDIGERLDIICAKEEIMLLDPLDDEEFEEFRSSELRQVRLDSLKEGEKIHEDEDTKVVFDALRELYNLLVTKHLALVQEWISVLIRVEVSDNRSRDKMLKEFIDIQNRLQLVKKKCEDSGCVLINNVKSLIEDELEEDFWEEGKIGSSESGSLNASSKHNSNLSMVLASSEVIDKASKGRNQKSYGIESMDNEGGKIDSTLLRSKLLAEAPVIECGSFSHNLKMDVLVNQRSMEFDNHWGRVDYEAVIPAEKIAELYWDYSTSSIEKSSLRDETLIDLGSDLGEQLAKQAIKNVRERDKEEARKRKIDKQLLNRAKLAEVREHNEAVLRDAALASTSRSAAAGDEAEDTNGRRSSSRNKKQTLASMLRKKVTTRDRLTQRLLNT
ncbi:UV-stimulated scaffold protein A-like [Citrus sinensis]|uniref:UV-stimulated scaffold protein A-like n=1 Tax=Citrus sinensis TaxID=2711 RepID=A0ACB8N9E9_CITSI|nr:UV-stimulated scaffold protein A-like [Citrus sinensis]